MILLAHPTANQNVRQTALALAESGLLAEFWTCLNWKQDGFLDRCLALNERVQRELRRRSFTQELQPFIKTWPRREWLRQMAGQLGLAALTKHESAPFSLDAVYRSLDSRVAKRLASLRNIEAVYAYDDGALETFRVAKNLGRKCIYDHPIVHWRKVRALQQEEGELHPEWRPTLLALRDSEQKLERKDEELRLADLVIVPSTFTKESVRAAPGLKAPVELIPYGAPEVGRRLPESSRVAGKLRVLFVGALSQAKGLSYLLDAIARLERHVDLTLIGQRVNASIPTSAVLDRHRWIPSLPHDRVLAEMSRHDVLVFPSLHEGFGLVILEALAQGIPVITTPHTAGPDVIEDGIDGFIVPIRSADAIAEKLELLLNDPALLVAMKNAAREKAAARPWNKYRERVVAVARELIAR